MIDIKDKEKKLENYLLSLKSTVVCFSSGIDSTYLLKKAKEVLKGKVIAVTAELESMPKKEIEEAIEFCKNEGIPHIVFKANELDIPEIKKNRENRCYFCKKNIFLKAKEIAKEYDIKEVIDGSNLDDSKEFRPGLKALEELKIKSPLIKANLTKFEIRILAKKLNLSNWNKPSFSCLYTRLEHGEIVTSEKLIKIYKAEEILRQMRV